MALNMFISRYSNRLRSFFATLKGDLSKGCGLKCDQVFYAIKDYFFSLLLLSQPVSGKDLYLYLAASATAVSTALVRLGEGEKP